MTAMRPKPRGRRAPLVGSNRCTADFEHYRDPVTDLAMSMAVLRQALLSALSNAYSMQTLLCAGPRPTQRSSTCQRP